MSRLRGSCVVAWFERWGERCLQGPQPDIYWSLLLHVGATDILRRYSGTRGYWLYVQAILDNFFSATERAAMCAELLDEPMFHDDPGFQPFLVQAKAEIRAAELFEIVRGATDLPAPLRSVG